MVPAIQGHTIPTLAMGWVILGLSVTFVVFLITKPARKTPDFSHGDMRAVASGA